MKPKHWLTIIFISTLVLRLILAFATPNFSYDSYFHLEQVEHITNTGVPLYNDQLSYGGRELFFLPLFHYLAAFLNFLMPITILAKILPNLLLSFLTIIIYLISKRITNNTNASLFSAVIVSLLPILYFTNSFTPTSLFLPLIFISIYAFLDLKEKKSLYLYILTFLLLCFTSSATILLLIGFGIYLLLSLVEGKKIKRAEIELILFSLLFYIWTQFLFFKNILLIQGPSFIWQNVPSQLIQDYFPSISLTNSIFLVTILPLITGIFIVYKSLFQLKNTKSFLLISIAISTTLLSWLKLINFNLSLSFFAIILSILFATFYTEFLQYIQETKLIKLKPILPIIILILLLTTMVYPAIRTSLSQDLPTNEEIEVFKWLETNTEPNTVIASLLEEGRLITYYGHRKNLMDNHFTMIEDTDKRFSALSSLFTTTFQTDALEVIDEYNIQYLVFTSTAKERYDYLAKPRYIDSRCFEKIYDDEISRVYQIKCVIKT